MDKTTRKSAYVLTPRTKTRLETNGLMLKCLRCGKKIKVGDEVVSKESRRTGFRKIYHKSCWEELFM